MLKFDPSDYQNFAYGIVPVSFLCRKGFHSFRLWNQDLILFWNGGDIRCFHNVCPHYGLPLDQGRITSGHVHCGFHGWQFDLSDGRLVNAPFAQKQPRCSLTPLPTFVRGGMVFVYPGDPDGLKNSKRFILGKVLERPQWAWIVYPVPFYLAMNSSMDFPHHDSHRFFYKLYGLYRALLFRKNPLRTTFTPEMLDEDETFFKFQIRETGVVLTVHPFCTEYHDVEAKNKWQIFVRPIDENNSQYIISIQSFSSSFAYRLLTYVMFQTLIKRLAMPEDRKWLGTAYENWRQKKAGHLCDHDFALRCYLRKFFISLPGSRSESVE